MKNKKLISLILVCAMMLVSTFTAYAEPTKRQSVSEPSQIATGNGVVEESGEFYEEIEAEEETFGTASSGAAMRSSSYEFFGQSTVPDGIYALQNYGNSNRWMDVQYDSTDPGYHMQQYAYGSTPADTQSAAALYKVTQVGSTGRYIIRLMLNQNLTFGISGSEVLTKTIPSNDSSVSIYDTFWITRMGSGYLIQPYDSEYCISAKDTTASGMDGAPDSYLQPVKVSVYRNQAKWMFEGQTTYIDDGVYALENVANTNRWIDTEQDYSDPGYHIQQYDYGDIPTVNFNRGALFKFAQVGSTGQYVIRSMLNNRMSFGISNGQFITKNIPTNDNSVSSSDRFIIQFWNGGYILRPYGQSSIVASNHSTASGVSGAPDSYLIPRTRSSAGNMGRWELYKYSGIGKSSLSYYADGAYIAGKNVTITVKTWSTIINANTPYVYTSSASIASTAWNSSTCSATINFHDEGNLTIYMLIRYASGTTLSTFTLNKSVVLPVEEGVYYIQNKQLKNFLQVDNDDSPNYSTDGAKIEMWYFDAGHHQKWEFIYIQDGYYQIKSFHSELSLAIQSSFANTAGMPIIQESYIGSNTQLWNLTKYTDDSFVISPKSAESYSKDWCMSVENNSENIDGRDVVQNLYTNNSDYLDGWFLYKCVDATQVFLLGIDHDNEHHDHYSSLVHITPTIFSLGYKEVSFILEDVFSSNTYLSYLQLSRLHVIRTHGGLINDGGSFLTLTTTSPSNVYVSVNDIYNFDTGEVLVPLVGCDLLMFVACKTAASERGFPQAAVAAGADCAVGFKENVSCSAVNYWVEQFFYYYNAGNSVENACAFAATDALLSGGTNTYVVKQK